MLFRSASATGEENVLEGKAAEEMNDLMYRRKQLEQLQEEVLDLEDISGGISITDFQFDDFRVELQRYDAAHPGLLETSPAGLHAVAAIPDELRGEVAPGVVFCLRQNDASRDPKDSNPTFPYCLVYVSQDGEKAVSYTHLDVYKRQGQRDAGRRPCRHLSRVYEIGYLLETTQAALRVPAPGSICLEAAFGPSRRSP